MDYNSCPNCGADLRQVGVREYGLVTFDITLRWNPAEDSYDMPEGSEPVYDECISIEYACLQCKADLGFDPNDPEEEDY
jgi:hypothetical protein